MRCLIITPPFTQLNTPYPASPYLKGFLNTLGHSTYQVDLGLEVILSLFSREGLKDLFVKADVGENNRESTKRIYLLREEYINTVDAVIGFLQGKNPTLAYSINQGLLPESARFDGLEDNILDGFGEAGMQDEAKHRCSLYLEDLSDFIVECVDSEFGFSRYAEQLGRSANSFDNLHASLNENPSWLEEICLQIFERHVIDHDPKAILITVPFPGNLKLAFRCAQLIKQKFADKTTIMGGGFVNTELRLLSEPLVFNYFDYITLDDGEAPLKDLLLHIENKTHISDACLLRTFAIADGDVVYINNSKSEDYKQSQLGTPDYSDLRLNEYISVLEMINPMHRLWSDGRWNKLTLAHGCYWSKCSFCDVSLDYIKRYEANTVEQICDRIENLIRNTNCSGFHFVDEAAPPSLMKDLAIEILRRGIVISWWTNIRFEKRFTRDLCKLLKASGCIAVSGGLEVASPRILELINKGVTLEQVAKVTQNFSEAGILVHAYLMYGFPSESEQETIDSLEVVRQLFESNCIKSGYWHHFALTTHSLVVQQPKKFGITTSSLVGTFANNDMEYFHPKDPVKDFSVGLRTSLYNYMHQVGFEVPINEWFDFSTPKTSIPSNYIMNVLTEEPSFTLLSRKRVLWLGSLPTTSRYLKKKKDREWEMVQFIIYTKKTTITISFSSKEGEWLESLIKKIQLKSLLNFNIFTLGEIQKSYETNINDHFELFWHSKPMINLRETGLLVI